MTRSLKATLPTLGTLTALSVGCAESPEASTPVPPPNIVLIQCDDLGWDDLGLHGNPLVDTPRLDALGRSSARFTDFTVNPVCAPSRATLLTGRHFLRTGVSHVHGGKDFLHLNERTLAEHFRAAGYATGMWGKWHSGVTEGYLPWQRGFDEAYMMRLYRHRATFGQLNGEDVEHDGWADTVMADYAIAFIRRHRDQPFFAYLPTMTPHSPHDAPEHWVDHYLEKGLSPELSRLWGMVSHLDEQIGRILDELEALGLSENTIVIFKSDNGPAIDGSTLSDEDRSLRKVSNLRGWKGDLYESGVRSPLFIRWPGKIAPREIERPTDLAELAPTLLDLAGITPVPGTPPMDGRSFRSLLQSVDKPDARLFFNYAHRGWLTSGPPYSLNGLPGEYRPLSRAERAALPFEEQSLSVRQGTHKLILNPNFRPEGAPPEIVLIDLATDPGETTDIGDLHPDIRDYLLAAMRAWWDQVREETHAFTAPTFHLRSGANTLPARAPSAVEGAVFNMVTSLRGWQQPGDRARYQLHAPSPGHATLTLRWRNDPPPGNRWILRIPETAASAETDGPTPVKLPLPSGPFLLEIELIETDGGNLPDLQAILLDFQPANP
ncbi:MAG: sulfatase-like hydrolase/transferase [Opitutales bacterium]|nr:sulfatase-like hydrolase/transferase [Opitutales bacterium]